MNERSKFAQASRALLRNSLLDAAATLLREYSWSDISMAAIATQAGVSRQTLYNEFGSREEFAQAFALREAQSFLSSVEAAISEHPNDPRAAIESAFARFLRDAAESPMVRAIVRRDPGADELLALFTTRGKPVIELATTYVTTAVQRHWRAKDDATLRVAIEALVRLAVSHASLPTSSPESAARAIALLLGPIVGQILVI